MHYYHLQASLNKAAADNAQLNTELQSVKVITDNSVNLTSPYRTLQGHSNHVMSVAYSPDGSQLASGSNDRTIKIWG